jgi:ABC-type transport system involved in multi-copper enzyme maturation permease subunit
MSDLAATAPHSAIPRKPRRTLREWLTRNPVALKELRGRMRGARAFVVLSVYLLVMSGFITLLYAVYLSSNTSVYSRPDRMLLGKFVFGGVVGIEMLLVCFIAPAFTVGAISGERERQTYDLLRTTLLSERALVWGKLISAFSYIFLLLLAALPLQSLAFLLGGVAPEEVLIATLLLLATAFLFSTAGIFFSSLMRRTLGATILTYAFALLTTLGLPILLFPLAILGPVFSLNAPPVAVQIALIYAFGLLVAINPVATMIATEVILVSNQTLFYFTTSIYNPASSTNLNVPLMSPWLPFTLFALVLGMALIGFSILNVRRVEQ